MAATGMATFSTRSIEFAHPANWRRSVEDVGDGAIIDLQSAGVTFALVNIFDASYSPEELVENALSVLREEHPGIEAEEQLDFEKEDELEMECTFLSLDTVSYCWLRSWRIADRVVLVMVQTIEPEAKLSEPIFRAICRSIRFVDGSAHQPAS